MEAWKITVLAMLGVLMLMPFGAIPLLRLVKRQKQEWDARPAPVLPKVYLSDKRAMWFQLAVLGAGGALFLVPAALVALGLLGAAFSDPAAAIGGLVAASITGLLAWGLFFLSRNFIYRLRHPDQLVLSADGICCDSLGVRRQWRWDQIEGARGRVFNRGCMGRAYLALKLKPGVDPQRVRGEPRVGHCTQALLPPYWQGTRFNRDASEDIAADIRAVMRAQGRQPLDAWMESQDWPGQLAAGQPMTAQESG